MFHPYHDLDVDLGANVGCSFAELKVFVEGSYNDVSESPSEWLASGETKTPVDGGEVFVTVHRSSGGIESYRAEVQNGLAEVPVDLSNWTDAYVQYLGLHPDNPTDVQEFTP